MLQRLTTFSFSMILFCLFLASDEVPAQSRVSFRDARRDFDAGRDPGDAKVGDFNKDGLADLATANSSDNSVSVLLGRGNGLFSAPADFSVGERPASLVIGEFSGDKILDLAVANEGFPSRGDLSILLGKGDGTFGLALSFAAGEGPRSLAAGDFNRDTVKDLAVTNSRSGSVSVLLGQGDGTFGPPQDFLVGSSPYTVAVGDFDRDQREDLAVANRNSATVSILRGQGDGTFGNPENFNAGISPITVVAGEFNGDGAVDLAVANEGFPPFDDPDVLILEGRGDGTFRPARGLRIQRRPTSLGLDDFNGDGFQDLVVGLVSQAAGTQVAVLLGRGDGTFAPPRVSRVRWAVFVAAGEFDKDGILDLAVATGREVSILIGRGDGSFRAAPTLDSRLSPQALAVADFNRDQIADILTVNASLGQSPTASVWLGRGDGTFDPPRESLAGRGPHALVVGQFNGDQITDIALTNYSLAGPTGVSILLGNGDGTFRPSQDIQELGLGEGLCVGEFNQDGIQDLAVVYSLQATNQVVVLVGRGDGRFDVGARPAVGRRPNNPLAADLNEDGLEDLAVTSRTGNVSVLVGRGDGTFEPARDFPAGAETAGIAAEDLDKDGHLDLAVTNDVSRGALLVLPGRGDGTFAPPLSYRVGAFPTSVVVSDFDADGARDLAVSNDDSYNVSILAGVGNGTFVPAQYFGVASGARNVATGDFNKDGLPDLAVENAGSLTVTLLINDTSR